jgi:hypothetical protein
MECNQQLVVDCKYPWYLLHGAKAPWDQQNLHVVLDSADRQSFSF